MCRWEENTTNMNLDWAMPGLKRWSLTAEARVRARVSVGFVVDKVALGQVFMSSLVFPCQYHSTRAPYSYIIWGKNNRFRDSLTPPKKKIK
jgi:hypothetical protein